MLKVVKDGADGQAEGLSLGLDDLAREGARQMLIAALDAEVAAYLERHRGVRDDQGHALVVRNGKAQARQVTMGSGTVEITAPRVNDRRTDAEGNRQRFTSAILPPYMRRSPKVAEVLPILYLRGLSTGDFQEALKTLLGDEAAGLSPSNISKLLSGWVDEYQRFRMRDLSDRDYVYIWADGVHLNIRLEDDRLCTLVILGARPDGTKELIAVEDGFRESAESWRAVLRDLKRRGMRAPELAIGDGSLGFWAAVRDVWPETREQRDWVHRMGNVLDKLPKRLQPKAKAALQNIMKAESRESAEKDIKAFVEEYGARYPKAVATLTRDQDKLLTYFDFPAEHWIHIRTSNPIESAFATVRLRQRITKGAGSRQRGLTMVFKLLEMAQLRWRKLNGAELLPLVRAGVVFRNGVRVERADQMESGQVAEDAA
ncbi:MAG: IS256 family transposase [Gemmatimonadota bacterium]